MLTTRKPMSEWKNIPCELSNEDVMQILKMENTHGQQKIADCFNIRQTTVSSITTGKTWKHLTRRW
jgi:hypothetical protein